MFMSRVVSLMLLFLQLQEQTKQTDNYSGSEVKNTSYEFGVRENPQNL